MMDMFQNLLVDESSSSDQQPQPDSEPDAPPAQGLTHSYTPESRTLCLNKHYIVADQLCEMAAGKWNFLRALVICGSNLGAAGLGLLVRTQWTTLEELHLNENRLGVQGARILARAHWPSLRELSVGSSELNNEGVIELIKGDWSNLNKLSFFYNRHNTVAMFHLNKLNCIEIEGIYGWMGYMDENLEEAVLKIFAHINNVFI